MSKYPDEAPVFRINDIDYEVRPVVSFCECPGVLMAITSNGLGAVWSIDFPEAFGKPLTPSARELLEWSRQ